MNKEIYSYTAPWPIYGLGCSIRPEYHDKFRIAIGSFVEDYSNKVEVVQIDDESKGFVKFGQFDHPYPTTKVLWSPDTSTSSCDLLATTGDYLRIWNITSNEIKMKSLLNYSKSNETCAPMTSFDWNETDCNIIGTSSIDTSCTIWDINVNQAKTQIIAHDKEVYDIAFSNGRDVFASVGADGSVRMFDLRALEHSTILYESTDLTPLLRVTWNKQDPNYIATFMTDQPYAIVLDIRIPTIPVAELPGHKPNLNAIAWAPYSSRHLCTAGEDKQALIWDISELPKTIEEPILAYRADNCIENMRWSSTHPDWIAICSGNTMQMLKA